MKHSRSVLSCAPVMLVSLCVMLAGVMVPLDSAQAKGKALLIGVENYAHGRKPLLGCRSDVNIMKEVLVEKGLFSDAEVRTLLDQEATRANIIRALEQWLIGGTRAGDTILFYFSGHGLQMSGADWRLGRRLCSGPGLL